MIIGTIKTLALLIFIFLASTSCSQKMTLNSNLDPENFRDYYSAGKVNIIQDESELPTPYKFIGLVEGQSCQQKAHHELPNEIAARTDTRRNAFALNANAVLFTSCILITNNEADKQCVATRVCYAKAYITKTNKH